MAARLGLFLTLRVIESRIGHAKPPTMFSESTLEPGKQESDRHKKMAVVFLALATASCLLQLLWFLPKCWNQINFDGIAYVGIARHLRQGQFYAAVNAFRSPLISWLIALASFGRSNFLQTGKLISVGTFLLCVGLLYLFTVSLWHSKVVASLAVLLFTLGRGLALDAVATVNADFFVCGAGAALFHGSLAVFTR
jgi:hypothetical protein